MKDRRAQAPTADERDARTPRKLISVGATVLLVALAIVGTTESDAGAWLALIALVVLIYGVHRFGRLGPEGA